MATDENEVGHVYNNVIFDKNKFQIIYKRLIKCGFNSNHCLRSLVATGARNEREAGKWLVSHIEDEELENDLARDYYIFLCPSNKVIHDAIIDLWETSKRHIGWNLAHDYPPHVTMMPQFQISDKKVVQLCEVIKNRFDEWLAKLRENYQILESKLEPLSSCNQFELKKNFIGFQFVGESRNYLEQLSTTLLHDLEKLGIQMDENLRHSRRGIFHLSLAYGFGSSQQTELTKLVEKYIDEDVIKTAQNLHNWSLCLFSADTRLRPVQEMFRMCLDSDSYFRSQDPSTRSQLDNYESQLLKWESSDMIGCLNNCNDAIGLVNAVNLNSGQSGLSIQPDRLLMCPQYLSWMTMLRCKIEMREGGDSTGYECVSLQNSVVMEQTKFTRQLLVMRHGERVDFCFKNWISKCFDKNGGYKRHNMNMPKILPGCRLKKPDDFFHDAPLTLLGRRVAYENGEALRLAGFSFTRCYSSPSLRCIETAAEVIRGLTQQQLEICVEPLLFEWMGWYQAGAPRFLNAEQLRLSGYPVNTEYKALSRVDELRCNETVTQYYDRKGRLVKKLMEQNKKKGASVLLIGHAASLDVCTRPFITNAHHSSVSWPPSHVSNDEFHARSSHVPFCGTMLIQQISNSKWKMIGSPILAFSHTRSPEFDWKSVFS